MSQPRGNRSEGLRKAYAAQRLENVSFAIAVLLTVTGLALILWAVFTPLVDRSFWVDREVSASKFYRGGVLIDPLFYAGLLTLALGILAFRKTVAYEIAKQGPRLPRRIRLPFDSVVEIGAAVNQVQLRTGMIVAGRGKTPESDGQTNFL